MVACEGQNTSTKPTNGGEDHRIINAPVDKGPDSLKLDPKTAKLSLLDEITLKESWMVRDYTAPSIELNLEIGDFLRVIRCRQSYQLRAPINLSPIFSEDLSLTSSKQDAKWAWEQAWEDRDSCQIVSSNLRSGRFEDLAAPTGHWYYVMNPCVSRENSSTYQESCSHDLVRTDVVEHHSELEEEIRQLSNKLLFAQSELKGMLQRASELSRFLSENMEACENWVAEKNRVVSIRKGLLSLGYLVGTVSLTLGMGMGLNASLAVGGLAQSFGDMLLTPYLLGEKNEDYGSQMQAALRHCSVPELNPEADFVDGETTNDKFEKMFRVKALVNELKVLLFGHEESDTLPLIDTKAMEVVELSNQMNEINSRVRSIDKEIRSHNVDGDEIDYLEALTWLGRDQI